MKNCIEIISALQRSARVWLAGLLGIWLAVPHNAAAETITVFAASSLRDAVEDIAPLYEAQTGTDMVLVFAASSAIARQMAHGAPADVVLVADQAWADWLVAEGAIETAEVFASNRLLLIGRDVAPITMPDDISTVLGGSVLAMAQVDAVPAGRYGKEALVSLGQWDALQGQVVQSANVRAALRFVERGEAALGIGYASDLVALPNLSEVYAFDADSHPVIRYSGAAVTTQGADFMTFLQSSSTQAILARWGFLPAGDIQ